MKKTVFVVGVLAFILSSCSFYTCPTYATKPAKETEKELQNV